MLFVKVTPWSKGALLDAVCRYSWLFKALSQSTMTFATWWDTPGGMGRLLPVPAVPPGEQQLAGHHRCHVPHLLAASKA